MKTSTLITADPGEDLAVVTAMAAELERYLTGTDVYRTLVISTDPGEERVQSSGGDLLARLHKLDAQRSSLSPAQQEQLQRARTEIDSTISAMRAPFHALLEREIKARLNSLTWYLDECEEDARQCRVNYPFEIRNRQRVAEIWKVIGAESPAGVEEKISAVDTRLRRLISPAPFVWDARARSVYPQSEYWYLYGLPSR